MKPEDSKFKYVYCDIVHRCNMECANCYLPFRHYPDLNTDKVIDFIKRFKVKTEFRFIGGEPTLHKDLAKIIKEATSFGHRTTIATNGLIIADFLYLKELKGFPRPSNSHAEPRGSAIQKDIHFVAEKHVSDNCR